jgi:hypothetical protein
VKTVAQLHDAVARLQPGGTVALADGQYLLSRPLHIRADRVTIRSQSGHRERVVLDGGGTLGEAVWVSACSGVTIADLTVQNVRWNGIKVNSQTGVQRLRIYNCVLRNIWQRGVKGVAVPAKDRDCLRPRDCRIEYCLFINDRPKRFSDDPRDTMKTFKGDYIGGIDVMFASAWVIRDNVFRGIRGRTRQGRGAVFLWQDSRDCVVEGNVIVDGDAGICLGNSSRDRAIPIHCSRCVVRNNCVSRAPEGGIVCAHTRDCKVLHNTVYDPSSRLGRGVRVISQAEGLQVMNNLLSGVRVLVATRGGVDLRDNREGVRDSLFADPAGGDLHLVNRDPDVVDAGRLLKDALKDLDGRTRGPRADLGAHELSPR